MASASFSLGVWNPMDSIGIFSSLFISFLGTILDLLGEIILCQSISFAFQHRMLIRPALAFIR
jgi:hypothetical protein